MHDQQETKSGLNLTWVPVVDPNGRVRMEARWAVAAASTTKPHPHAA